MTETTRRRHPVRALALLLLAALAVYFVTGYVRSLFLESSHVALTLQSRSGQTGAVRIAQVSDLHRAVYGEDNSELVALIASKYPNLIVATGDMIDVRTEGIDECVDLFARLRKIAPVVYSLGNHEVERPDLRALVEALEDVGVLDVDGNVVTVEAGGLSLRIGGLYRAEYLPQLEDDGAVDILLCHFPDKLRIFAENGVPLTFCGHTHGGQFRIPLLDIALYAPGQGWFPEYTTGLYEQDGSYMIVSRGLGNSSFPFRIHNPPEVVVADITYVSAL